MGRKPRRSGPPVPQARAQLRDELKAGDRNPTFEQVLKQLVQIGVCGMMKGANL